MSPMYCRLIRARRTLVHRGVASGPPPFGIGRVGAAFPFHSFWPCVSTMDAPHDEVPPHIQMRWMRMGWMQV